MVSPYQVNCQLPAHGTRQPTVTAWCLPTKCLPTSSKVSPYQLSRTCRQHGVSLPREPTVKYSSMVSPYQENQLSRTCRQHGVSLPTEPHCHVPASSKVSPYQVNRLSHTCRQHGVSLPREPTVKYLPAAWCLPTKRTNCHVPAGSMVSPYQDEPTVTYLPAARCLPTK